MKNFKLALFISLGLAVLGGNCSSANTKNAPLTEESPTLLFYGNSMVECLLEHGEIEARMQIAMPNQGLKIRSLAWTGDEVGNSLRLESYPKHMKNLIQKWPVKFPWVHNQKNSLIIIEPAPADITKAIINCSLDGKTRQTINLK